MRNWPSCGCCGSAAPSTVRQVHEALSRERPSAYTTALKMLQIMTEKGLVRRDDSDRTHVYQLEADGGADPAAAGARPARPRVRRLRVEARHAGARDQARDSRRSWRDPQADRDTRATAATPAAIRMEVNCEHRECRGCIATPGGAGRRLGTAAVRLAGGADRRDLTRCILWLLRNSAPDVRYVVGTIGLSLMLTMPVVTGGAAVASGAERPEAADRPIGTCDVPTPARCWHHAAVPAPRRPPPRPAGEADAPARRESARGRGCRRSSRLAVRRRRAVAPAGERLGVGAADESHGTAPSPDAGSGSARLLAAAAHRDGRSGFSNRRGRRADGDRLAEPVVLLPASALAGLSPASSRRSSRTNSRTSAATTTWSTCCRRRRDAAVLSPGGLVAVPARSGPSARTAATIWR